MEYHPVVTQIRTLLDTAGVSYQTYEHAAVRTSEEAAALRPEYTLAQGAKALLIRVKYKGDQPPGFVQVVVPGDARFDTKRLRQQLGAKDVRFATEAEVDTLTGGVQPGGVPPFGNLFDLPVYADETLFANDTIIFNAGDRAYSIAMATKDYERVVQPHVVSVRACA